MFGVWIALLLFGLYAVLNQRSAFTSYFDDNGSFREILDADDLVAAFGVLTLIWMIATIIVFLIWFSRSYGNISPLTGRRTEFTHGWAVGAWFVPFLNFARPFQMAEEMWVARRFEDPRPAPAKGLLIGWWVMLLFSNVFMRFVNGILNASYQDSDLRNARSEFLTLNAGNLITIVALIITAVLAIVVVRTITVRHAALAAEASLTI